MRKPDRDRESTSMTELQLHERHRGNITCYNNDRKRDACALEDMVSQILRLGGILTWKPHESHATWVTGDIYGLSTVSRCERLVHLFPNVSLAGE
jgi:hypothetical protein